MSISWEQFVDAFKVGSDTGNIEQLASMITEDFNWVTSDMDREATLSWTSGTSFKINGDAQTLYENEEVIAGTHRVLDDEGKQNLVMGVARLRDGKVYRYDHMRQLSSSRPSRNRSNFSERSRPSLPGALDNRPRCAAIQ